MLGNSKQRHNRLCFLLFRNTRQSVKKLAKNLNKSVDKLISLWYYCKALEREPKRKGPVKRAKDLEN